MLLKLQICSATNLDAFFYLSGAERQRQKAELLFQLELVSPLFFQSNLKGHRRVKSVCLNPKQQTFLQLQWMVCTCICRGLMYWKTVENVVRLRTFFSPRHIAPTTGTLPVGGLTFSIRSGRQRFVPAATESFIFPHKKENGCLSNIRQEIKRHLSWSPRSLM